jgi:hypothetical protein
MTLEYTPILLTLSARCVKTSLIHVVVFSTDIESVSLFLWELHSIDANRGLVILPLWILATTWVEVLLVHTMILLEHCEAYFWVVKLTKMPLTNLAIVRN